MDQDLLLLLLAAFPKSAPASPAENDAAGDYLVICGYRVPFDYPAAIDRG